MSIVETYITYKFILDIVFTVFGILVVTVCGLWHLYDERKVKRK